MSRFAQACNASPANRVLRGFIALFIAAFALASLDTPLVAAFGAVAALYVGFLAVTGWCPGTVVYDPQAVDLTDSEADHR